MTDGHRRRPHYSGKYPRHFQEKYKELDPERYSDTVAHVIAKGSTPAGMHIPIMVNEILEVLDIKPGERGFDATLGYGGHTEKMLEKLCGEGHIYGCDVDPIESAKTLERIRSHGYDAKIFSLRNMNFADIDKVVTEVGKFDFILADLGVSSMQIDDPSRGFSYKSDGPLDLRLDPSHGISASESLGQMSVDEIEGMLIDNADETEARKIAREIVRSVKMGKLNTTYDLRGCVERAFAKKKIPSAEMKDAIKKSCTRTFQAVRIDVNNEYEVLETFMEKLPEALKPAGRAAILTFHSGEDRIVKQAFRSFYRAGVYSRVAKEVIRPSATECHMNPRAHSTKLRWAVKA